MRAQTEVRRGETFLMMKVNKSFVLWSWGGSWRDTDNCAYCVPRCIVNVNSNSNVMLTFIGLKSPRTVLRGGEGFLYAFVLFFSVRATTGTSTALYLVNYIYIYIEREENTECICSGWSRTENLHRHICSRVHCQQCRTPAIILQCQLWVSLTWTISYYTLSTISSKCDLNLGQRVLGLWRTSVLMMRHNSIFTVSLDSHSVHN